MAIGGVIVDIVDSTFHIPSISKETNFWMIRTKKGFFFNEFISKEYIAIGWNLVTHAKIKGGLTKAQANELKAQIEKEYGEAKPGAALNKCIRFCDTLKEGDIAVIVDNGRIAFAQIGKYYEESSAGLTVAYEKEINEKIENASHYFDSFECPYVKRRKISVIKTLKGDTFISPYLQSAMSRNWHSLSNLNEYAELILSACYDTFIYHGNLSITFRVAQEDNITALDLSSFIFYAAKMLSGEMPDAVSVKTALHSPGDVILQIANFVKDNALPFLLGYIAIFGGRVGDYEFNSIIGVIKNIMNAEYDKKKRELELRKLEAETKIAEQEAINKELDNIERKRKLQTELVDKYAKPLNSVADKLQIKPDDSTVIAINEIVGQQSSEVSVGV
jgi:hypothetical protein